MLFNYCYPNNRAIGVATNSTQEVGQIFMNALRDNVPGLQPKAYLGDAAEAFANAAQHVFGSNSIRLMCTTTELNLHLRRTPFFFFLFFFRFVYFTVVQ